ncbi:MAG: hypothetical protein LBU44_00770 [Mediterranea sp.]|jgi:hypothetical protein|nr:hypothetical protein [Mediterranea sp.]
MFNNCLHTLFRHRYLILVLLLWGCSSDPGDSPIPIEEDPEEVAVTFSVGHLTRADFPEDTPLKIYVFRRAIASAPDFSVTPHRIVIGKTSEKNVVLEKLENGTVLTDGILMVRYGYKYDFVAVVNATPTAKDFGTFSFSSGALTGFTHGTDILAGKVEGAEASGNPTINVEFNKFGAVAGELPHLCSAVCVEARITEDFFKEFITKPATATSFKYAVAGMDFKSCLPRRASLPFSGDPIALNVIGSGYTTSYSVSFSGTEVEVDDKDDKATSDDGIILPYSVGRIYNTLNLDFRLRVNDGETTLEAQNVQAPPFEPGYRYRFIVELDGLSDKINLYLSREPWSSIAWQSGMGETDTQNPTIFSLGSWSSVSWQTGMGGSDNNNMFLVSASGWNSATWASQMGD